MISMSFIIISFVLFSIGLMNMEWSHPHSVQFYTYLEFWLWVSILILVQMFIYGMLNEDKKVKQYWKNFKQAYKTGLPLWRNGLSHYVTWRSKSLLSLKNKWNFNFIIVYWLYDQPCYDLIEGFIFFVWKIVDLWFFCFYSRNHFCC